MALIASGINPSGYSDFIRLQDQGYVIAELHNLLPCPDCESPRFVDRNGAFMKCAMCVVLAKLG